MDSLSKKLLVTNYTKLLHEHQRGPEVSQWTAEGQRYRFEKLVTIGDLANRSVLDVGCGLADLYVYIRENLGDVRYTGVDIVPDLVARARQLHPGATFEHLDLTEDRFEPTFEYVLISGIFNNNIPDSANFIRAMLRAAYARCTVALGFNFISTHTSFRDDHLAYHDPIAIFDFCVRELSLKVDVSHCYERRDVSVFVYR